MSKMNAQNIVEIVGKNLEMVKKYSERLLKGESIAKEIFGKYNTELEGLISDRVSEYSSNGELARMESEAAKDLASWTEQSGRTQKYNAEELAHERIVKEVGCAYRSEKEHELAFANVLHQSIVNYALRTELAARMVEEGCAGNKLAVVELSARISPGLTFHSASKYLSCVVIPYGTEARSAIGEQELDCSLVSFEAAYESAKNAAEKFGANYVLAESSAAPSKRVVKSRKKPRVYFCTLTPSSDQKNSDQENNSHEKSTSYHEINTEFRDEFDSIVREICFQKLTDMYLN